MVNKLLTWLGNKTWLNVILLVAYFSAVVLPHEIIGRLIARHLDVPLGRDTYNLVVLGLASLGLLGYLGLLFTGFRKLTTEKKKVGFYLFTTLLLIVLAFNILMVVNVELIHIVQYAVCAILLFPLLKNYGSTIFWIAILGTIDEAYQYFVLAPFRTDYFDFNDVVIDLLGGGLGLIFVKAMGLKQKKYEWYRSPIIIGTTLVTLLFTFLFRFQYLAIFPTDQIEGLPFLLVKRLESGFWNVTNPNIKFHVMQPLEGTLIIIGLIIFYKFLGENEPSLENE